MPLAAFRLAVVAEDLNCTNARDTVVSETLEVAALTAVASPAPSAFNIATETDVARAVPGRTHRNRDAATRILGTAAGGPSEYHGGRNAEIEATAVLLVFALSSTRN